MLTRLNKYLSECGIASRRKSEEFITQGRITVNNKVITDFSCKIDVGIDEVCFDGEPLKNKKKVYFLLNKPTGVITSTKDEKGRDTVINLIKTREKIFPVGRLDYNTTGVLFLTNDGEFSNFITHPKHKIMREYLVVLDKPLEVEHKEKLRSSIMLDGRRSKFLSLSYPKKDSFKTVLVTCEEGRNHFVKRMFGLLGYKVEKLHRSAYAGLQVGVLKVGQYRELSGDEVEFIIKNNSKKVVEKKK